MRNFLTRVGIMFLSVLGIYSGCKIDSGGESGSETASIKVGEVPQTVLSHDDVEIKVAKDQDIRTYRNRGEMAAAKFKPGDSVELSMTLKMNGRTVAASLPSNANCRPVTINLRSGTNPVTVPICPVDGNNQADNGKSPILINPDDDANIEATPCVVGKENCNGNSGNSGNSGGVTGTTQNTGIKINLTWGENVRDLEVHLVKNGGFLNNLDGGNSDCTWTNLNPDWGPFGPAGNCIKDRDDKGQNGNENIILMQPEGTTYNVYVEYWDQGSPATARLVADVDGNRSTETISNLLPKHVWHVLTIDWNKKSAIRINSKIDCSINWNRGCQMRLR